MTPTAWFELRMKYLLLVNYQPQILEVKAKLPQNLLPSSMRVKPPPSSEWTMYRVS